jgi:predicted transcriptional regulator
MTSTLYTFPDLKHRYQADIIAAILEAAASGEVPKSKLYHKSFLTYNRLKACMRLLVTSGLIECIECKDFRSYRTTEKGMLFLQAYNGMVELLCEA